MTTDEKYQYLLKNESENMYAEVITQNSYDIGEFELQNREVIDIGANVGMFTALALLKGASKVIAVEPVASTFSILASHINNLEYIDKVLLLKNVVSDESNKLIQMSLLDSSIRNSTYEKTDKTEKVLSISLPDILRHTTNNVYLKMDCEGSEYDILMNLKRDDLKNVSTIGMEVHGALHPLYRGRNGRDALANKLGSMGFKNIYSKEVFYFSYDPSIEPVSMDLWMERWHK